MTCPPPMADRFTPVRLHPCGCETRFDTLLWHSETVKECVEHAAIRRVLADPTKEGE